MRHLPRMDLLLATLALLTAAPLHAAPITITNHSFEQVLYNGDPYTLADGKFVQFHATNAGYGNTGLSTGAFTFPGWTIFNDTGLNGGVFNPGSASTTDGAVPDGSYAAYLVNNFAIHQTLSHTLQNDFVYTLSVAVIDRIDTTFAGYVVELVAGSTVIASMLSSNPGATVIPTSGWADVVISVDSSTLAPALLGSALSIRLAAPLTGKDHQTLFDNVRLDATGPQVIPAPVTLGVLALAAPLLISRLRPRNAR